MAGDTTKQRPGIKFTLEELVNCCYILDGINERDFRSYLTLINNDSAHTTKDYPKLLAQYLSKKKDPVSNVAGLKFLAPSESINDSFKHFRLNSQDNNTDGNNKPPSLVLKVQTSDGSLEKINPSRSNSTISETKTINSHDQLLLDRVQNLIEISKKFKQFVLKYRCEENLEFLIEIYNYEKIWNVCFADRRFSILKCKLPELNNINIAMYPQKKSVVSSHSHPSVQKSSIASSIDSNKLSAISGKSSAIIDAFSNMKGSFDVSSIVDIALVNSEINHGGYNSELSNDWDYEFAKKFDNSKINETPNPSSKDVLPPTQINIIEEIDPLCGAGDNQLLCPCDQATPTSPSNPVNPNLNDKLVDRVRGLLIEKWESLMDTFVNEDAPHQINLPQDVLDNIQSENKNQDVWYHSPSVLVPAKDSVVEILRDNIYNPFIKEFSKNLGKQEKHQKLAKPENTPPSTENISSASKTGDLSLISSNLSDKPTKIKTENIPKSDTSTIDSIEQFTKDSTSAPRTRPNSSQTSRSSKAPLSSSSFESADNNSAKSKSTTSPLSSTSKASSAMPAVPVKCPCGVIGTESSYSPKPPLNKKIGGWLRIKNLMQKQKH
ncbi:hypothetical protein DASC09_061020 [Saccharomycopsis crataegensis]|uniref:RGS domain-containing protein n=1 Tax=Saccharomycopsis crataegensis TaxID=43959 RepID=A0AAV5QV06_9ASCO|nr:hypothetical protein DASC09_061020 [Saccharomycopsis crataegensis]